MMLARAFKFCWDDDHEGVFRLRQRSQTRSLAATRVARTCKFFCNEGHTNKQIIHDDDCERASSAATKVAQTSNSTAMMIVNNLIDCENGRAND